MPSVCNCPYCGQACLIPDDLDSATTVQCPHCQYEFSGDRAWLYAVEAPPEHVAELPPTLILVHQSEDVALTLEASVTDDPATEDGGVVRPSPPEPSSDEQLPAAAMSDTGGENEGPISLGPTAEMSSPVEDSKETTRPADAAAERIEAGDRTTAAAGLSEAGQSASLHPETEPGDAGSERSPAEDSGLRTAANEPLLLRAPEYAGSPDQERLASADESDTSDTAEELQLATPGENLTAIGQLPADSSGTLPTPANAVEQPADEALEEPRFGQPLAVRRERRKRNSVRTAVGMVVSGLLGLAVPYGAWVGLAKLGIVGRSRTPAAESNHAQLRSPSAGTDATMITPPQPTDFDEWPGLDENRFADPKESKKDDPSGRGKKRTPRAN